MLVLELVLKLIGRVHQTDFVISHQWIEFILVTETQKYDDIWKVSKRYIFVLTRCFIHIVTMGIFRELIEQSNSSDKETREMRIKRDEN